MPASCEKQTQTSAIIGKERSAFTIDKCNHENRIHFEILHINCFAKLKFIIYPQVATTTVELSRFFFCVLLLFKLRIAFTSLLQLCDIVVIPLFFLIGHKNFNYLCAYGSGAVFNLYLPALDQMSGIQESRRRKKNTKRT